ncbi:hypothetical protein SEPCBS57363_000300 [Sporothrix epigloea]|uniref:BZIP domain-containing protein n=1 Tax=Sporothrix epigloea TaxID=1892477 RepID=A0ABP0D5M8_9PEZI
MYATSTQTSPVNTAFQVRQQPPPYAPHPERHQQYQHYQQSYTEDEKPLHQMQQTQQHPYHQYQVPRTQLPHYSQPLDLRNADGVSPESSPEISATEPVYSSNIGRQDVPDISPVDREADPFVMSATPASPESIPAGDGRPPSASRTRIPMIRRERRQNAEANAKTLREAKSRERLQQLHEAQERTNSIASSKRGYKGGEVRWDPQTGELTSSQKGRPSQVKPADYARGLADTGTDATKSTGATVKDSKVSSAANGIANFASRLRKTVQNVSNSALNSPSVTDLSPSRPPTQPRQEVVPPQSPAASQASPVAVPLEQTPAPVAATPTDVSSSTDPAAGLYIYNGSAWNGETGGTTSVKPALRESSKHAGPMPTVTDDPITAASPIANAATSSQAMSSITQTPTRKPLQAPTSSGAQSYPSPPQSVGPTYKALLPPQQQETPVQAAPQLQQEQRPPSTRIRRKPTPSHQALASYDENDPFNYNNRPYPSIVPSPVSLRLSPQEDEWTQPPSRFSVTTYNSTLDESQADGDLDDAPEVPPIPDSLRSSPPLEAPQQQEQQTVSPHPQSTPFSMKPIPGRAVDGNVMSRRRPPRMGFTDPNSIKNGNDPILISLRTPWSAGNTHSSLHDMSDSGSDHWSSGGQEQDDASAEFMYIQLRKRHLMGLSAAGAGAGVDGGADASAERASMVGSIHKDLPLAPPEMTAKDRVAMFNAQLSGLAQRRINIGRSIKQMTELMPTDNLLAAPDVLFKREMEKRKVEGLRIELAEIQREEYEIGLKLHRAYKRLDKNAEYEPTTLWVRRVTG